MKLKFWGKKEPMIPFSVSRTECPTASIQCGIIPDGQVQYINVTAIDNQRVLELFRAVREELNKK